MNEGMENMRAEKMAAVEAQRREQDGLMQRMDRISAAMNELREQAGRLEGRLEPVLRQPEPSPALHPPSTPAETALAQFLAETTDQLGELTWYVTSMWQRVDL